MQTRTDKRDRAALFRHRLSEAMQGSGTTRSALARAAGVDRSTISQILAPESPRLPNAQLAADVAQALGVSLDWLMGLTDRPERPGAVIAAAIQLTEAERNDADTQVLQWHREAAGAKVRHVPATLPDMLKTEAVKRWEYAAFLGHSPADPASTSMAEETDWLESGEADYEIALPLHELDAFARGTGYYHGLPAGVRAGQIRHLRDQCARHYPTLRLYAFDAKRAFSAPLGVYGTRLAVIYVGRFYLAFRDTDRVRSLIRHFDWLVREASVDARDAPAHLDRLLVDIVGG